MSLPLPVIERLFARLNATYGRDFISRYEGQDVAAVKTSWGHELDGYSHHLNPLAWALENLPEKPPNVIEFRSLCRRAPESKVPALPAPKADPARVEVELVKLTPLRAIAVSSPVDHKAWAYTLQKRHTQGDRLNANQKRCYKAALGIEA